MKYKKCLACGMILTAGIVSPLVGHNFITECPHINCIEMAILPEHPELPRVNFGPSSNTSQAMFTATTSTNTLPLSPSISPSASATD
jgi:hypothetical protein